MKAATLGLAVCVLLTGGTESRAGSLSFTFSFSDDGGGNTGLGSTVTGLIEGLSDNSTGPASNVFITSIPGALVNNYGYLPIDAAAWSDVPYNCFTTVDGQITDAVFFATDEVNGLLWLNYGIFSPDNALTLDDFNTNTLNYEGFGGATYTPYDGPGVVPEPATIAMFGSGFLCFAAYRWRRRQLPVLA